MSAATAVLGRVRVLPVVSLTDAALARPLAEALLAGGLPIAEITLRTPAGLAAIAAAAAVPGFTVAAGTVLTAEQVDACVDAGAGMIVSPGLDDAVVARAQERGAAAVPGVATATEVQRALAAGCTDLKLFPAGLLGGPDLIRALGAPFPQVRFVPSGGVSAATAPDYAALPNVLAVSGSWMVPADAVASDPARITALAREAVAAVSALVP
ncbi:bifunctional 4-hydroxy-2-oxoglutarate aldolase/2-dehydro-3-deoxy-phosphogluconate aldolase [Amnibacterium setariae]|uniref:2-dehydro-3-deoxy-phosphogluconate aldolase n=1 Tax=Amnibacterium setariae TaxID=2306585 RepID=A0A3A1TY32_9MICO|nr:bifunctional 4-hydroxy-2-oxoglutarate aldolase/2-dehydro-3-deoxy-phosphogluconate aldolase [Amnibacterium setariae]RIX28498.1 bifunctional 4-hydroxy-2-oxoglutarate aldolase/2-dehydro-3-deoxy-phosphogluconate aldolase [Amnibacterium setariae]